MIELPLLGAARFFNEVSDAVDGLLLRSIRSRRRADVVAMTAEEI
jgi:hypothetical protein